MDRVKGEMNGSYSRSRIDMRPIVNMISETSKLSEVMSNMNSIQKTNGLQSESEADKLDLKVELLL